jgi:hypothetical protein
MGSGETTANGNASGGVLTSASLLILPVEHRAGSARTTAASGTCPRQLTIEVAAARIAPGERVVVHVFIGKAEVPIDNPPTDPGYLGSFSFFPATGQAGAETYTLSLARLSSRIRGQLCSSSLPPVALALAPIVQGASATHSEVEIQGAVLE